VQFFPRFDMSSQREQKDYYAILGVARTASLKEIRAAFRVRAKALHPDKNRQRETKEDFQRIQEAYAVLVRPEQRRRYDFKEPAADPTSRPRRWWKYGFAGLAIAVLALALLFYRIYRPATSETLGSPPKATELDKEMETAIYRYAQSYTGLPPEPATVEVIGKEGRKFVVSRADYKRLVPIYDRLVTESKHLQKRKEDLDVRRADLEKEGRELASSNIAAGVEFRMKVNEFNSDGATFRQHFELHAAEVEDYFRQIERVAVRDR
jgi:curved DNA-binding protein CbpA